MSNVGSYCYGLREAAIGNSDPAYIEAWSEFDNSYCKDGGYFKLYSDITNKIASDLLLENSMIPLAVLVEAGVTKYLIAKGLVGATNAGLLQAAIVLWSAAEIKQGVVMLSDLNSRTLKDALVSHVFNSLSERISKKEISGFRHLTIARDILSLKRLQSALMKLIWSDYKIFMEENDSLEFFSGPMGWMTYAGISLSGARDSINSNYDKTVKSSMTLYTPDEIFSAISDLVDLPSDPVISPDLGQNVSPISIITPSGEMSVQVGTAVSLSGSESYDPDDSVAIAYRWALLGKPNNSAVGVSGVESNIAFVPDVEGAYTLELTVSDGVETNSVRKTVVAYNTYSSAPELLPEEKIIGPISGGANSYRYFYIDVPDESINKIILWMYGSSKVSAGPADVYVSYEENPTVAFTHPYDPTVPVVDYQYGDPNDLSREEFEISNPKVGRYHVLLYGFMESYSNVNLFFQFEQGVSDSDADGVPDAHDAFPNDRAASLDTDEDGHPDAWNVGQSEGSSTTGLRLDDFPSDRAASLDTDGDGHPDTWNTGRSQVDSNTGLSLDAFPLVASEWIDSDDDGVGDIADRFPNDRSAWQDNDGDGYPDAWNPGQSANDSQTGLVLDSFPEDRAAYLDSDGDGRPDSWNRGMTQADSQAGLMLDAFPFDRTEWADSDLDGVGDNSDWAPDDFREWADSDGDMVGDNADAAPFDRNRSGNIAPSIEPIGGLEVEAGAITNVALSVTDLDGDSVSVTLLNAPPFVELQSQAIQVAPSKDILGRFDMVVLLDDGFGGIANATVSIQVISDAVVEDTPDVSEPYKIIPIIMQLLGDEGPRSVEGEMLGSFNFEDDSLSNAPDGFLYRTDWGDIGTIRVQGGISGNTSNTLRVVGALNHAQGVYVPGTVQSSGTVELKLKVLVEDGVTVYRNSSYTCYGGACLRLLTGDGGGSTFDIQVDGSEERILGLSFGQWYELTATFDLDQETIEVEVNGQTISVPQFTPNLSGGWASDFSFYGNNNGDVASYYDDIILTRY